MNQLIEKSIACPYCAEVIEVLIDYSDLGSPYTEDCQVCCQPIVISISEAMDGELLINAYREDDSF